MKHNAILIRGTNRTKLWAYDMSVRLFPNVYPQLEFYSRYPVKLADTPVIVWDGKDEANFYYKTNKPLANKWILKVSSIIHEKLKKDDFPYFNAPIEITRFNVIKSRGD